jgi:hypothetical protein
MSLIQQSLRVFTWLFPRNEFARRERFTRYSLDTIIIIIIIIIIITTTTPSSINQAIVMILTS